MFGFGSNELLIIAVVLIVMIGIVVGAVALVTSLARRRDGGTAGGRPTSLE